MGEKLTRWLIFGILLGLTPLVFSALRVMVRGTIPSPSQLFAHGELLLIAAGISAGAVGELLVTTRARRIAKYVAGGVSLFVLMLSSLYFADISAAYLSNVKVNADLIAFSSLGLLAAAIISAGICRVLAET